MRLSSPPQKDQIMTSHIAPADINQNAILPRFMRAATYKTYGPPNVVEITKIPMPKINDNQVLIRTRAASVSTGDWRARSLSLPKGFGPLGRLIFGVFGPRKQVLGTELSGEIIAIGANVTKFSVGDAVIAFADVGFGCHAEYKAFDQDGLMTHKPENISFEQAAALCFGGTTALGFLRAKGNVQQGEKVLIIGASGSVGSAAVQIAKYLGAEVTGVCSTRNIDMVKKLGADHVIDYTLHDVTKLDDHYDVVLNANAEIKIADIEAILRPRGRLLLVLGSFKQALGIEKLSRKGRKAGKRIFGGVASTKQADLEFLASLASKEHFVPVIDHAYPLNDAICAHAQVDAGHKSGNIVLVM